jgi:isocitrate/isopropylmalate dehydrogenase
MLKKRKAYIVKIPEIIMRENTEYIYREKEKVVRKGDKIHNSNNCKNRKQ